MKGKGKGSGGREEGKWEEVSDPLVFQNVVASLGLSFTRKSILAHMPSLVIIKLRVYLTFTLQPAGILFLICVSKYEKALMFHM